MAHRIYAHGTLEPLASNLWQVTAEHGLPILRNMAVYRLASGGLLIHSAIALDDAGMQALDALGTPEVMVIPHAYHAMDAAFYQERYPNAAVGCPAESHADVTRRRGVRIDGTPQEVLQGLEVVAHDVPGLWFDECVLEVPIDGGMALLFCDALANDGREPPGLLGRVMGLIGVPGGGLGASRMLRLFTTDRNAYRDFLRGLAAREDLRLIQVAHGAPVVDNTRQALSAAADAL